MRIIGEVTSYAGLVAALRLRLDELGTTRETVDEVAGLPARYAGKLLSPNPVKSLGRSSLGLLLGTLGVKLIVAVDEVALERIRHRLTPSRWSANRRAVMRRRLIEAAAAVEQTGQTSGKHRCAGDSGWGRRGAGCEDVAHDTRGPAAAGEHRCQGEMEGGYGKRRQMSWRTVERRRSCGSRPQRRWRAVSQA
jgi:hypothetical protein